MSQTQDKATFGAALNSGYRAIISMFNAAATAATAVESVAQTGANLAAVVEGQSAQFKDIAKIENEAEFKRRLAELQAQMQTDTKPATSGVAPQA